jgi:glycosyltransferase involved in cell wall biosynthesis
VPVYQHWHCIPALLDCLRAQTLPQHQFEIVLVDNGCEDFAPPTQLPGNARIEHCSTPASYAARNHAIARARGEWLVFTDADCLPDKDWLRNLMEAGSSAADASVILAGAINMVAISHRPGWYERYDRVKGIPQARYAAKGYATTANLAVPAYIARQLEYFNSTRYSGADAEFCRRAGTSGVEIRYVANAIVDHPARRSWKAIETKARRIKGGQLINGTRRQRSLWWIHTFTPPVRACARFLVDRRVPLRDRLIAVTVQIRVWSTEMRESFRLLRDGIPERR